MHVIYYSFELSLCFISVLNYHILLFSLIKFLTFKMLSKYGPKNVLLL